MEEYTLKTKVIGVDISVNCTTYAIVDVRGNIVAINNFNTRKYPLIEDFVKALSRMLALMMEQNGGIESIRSVGVSCPSANPINGCIENAPNLPWKGIIPLEALLCDSLGIAVVMTRNANAIALGEHSFGSAHGMKNFAIITMGHGLGCGYFSQGQLVNGNSGLAGEFGHICIAPNGRRCECGLQGCLETYVAEKGIIRTAKEILERSNESSTMRDFDADKLTPENITECCYSGDKLAIEVYEKTGMILGAALASLAAIIDPEAIILTGGISNASNWIFNPVRKAFNTHLFHNLRGKIKILKPTLNGHERDVLGASVLAWSVKEYSLFK